MNIEFSFQDAFYGLAEELGDMSDVIVSESKSAMKKISDIYKKNVESELRSHRPEIESSMKNYDGTPYIHMDTDVKASIKDDKKGSVTAVIRGGKYTGYKWHLVNNGTIKSRAIHFIEGADKKSESESDTTIDNLVYKAVMTNRG